MHRTQQNSSMIHDRSSDFACSKTCSMPALNSARCDRRGFLQAALAGAGAVVGARLSGQPAFAARPIVRRGGAHMKLSLAAYSFHKLLPYERKAADFKDAPMVLEDVIHFAADQNLDGVELTSYYFPTDLDSKYLFHLKDLTFRLGLDISGTAIRNDFCLPAGDARAADLAHTRRWIDYAAAMGAPSNVMVSTARTIAWHSRRPTLA